MHCLGAGGSAVTCRDLGKPIRAAETNGSYLHKFRRHQSVDTSTIKQVSDHESVANTVVPPPRAKSTSLAALIESISLPRMAIRHHPNLMNFFNGEGEVFCAIRD